MSKKLNSFIYDTCHDLGLAFPDLPCFAVEHYGQVGEDILVLGIIEAWRRSTNAEISELQYCEIGGNHPIATSNSYLLAKTYGMSGVICEANPALIEPLRQTRPNDTIIHAAITPEDVESVSFYIANRNELSSLSKDFVETWPSEGAGVKEELMVPAVSISKLLQEQFPDAPPLLLSIDVEGVDFELVKAVDFTNFRPLLVQVEPSEHYQPGIGATITDHFFDLGYRMIAATDVNILFADIKALFPIGNQQRLGGGDAEEAEAEIIDLRKRLSEAEKGINSQTRLIDERDAWIEDLRGRLSDAEKGASAQTQMIDERDAWIVDLQSRLSDAENAKKSQSQLIDERDASIGDLQDQLSQTTQMLDAKTKSIGERDAMIDDLRVKLSESENASAAQADLLRDRTSSIETLRAAVDTNLMKIEEMTVERRSLDKRLGIVLKHREFFRAEVKKLRSGNLLRRLRKLRIL